jgi:hypothetical protein
MMCNRLSASLGEEARRHRATDVSTLRTCKLLKFLFSMPPGNIYGAKTKIFCT